MKHYLVLVETEGRKLPKKNGNYIDLSGFTIVDEVLADSQDEAIKLGEEQLKDWGLDGEYNIIAYHLF